MCLSTGTPFPAQAAGATRNFGAPFTAGLQRQRGALRRGFCLCLLQVKCFLLWKPKFAAGAGQFSEKKDLGVFLQLLRSSGFGKNKPEPPTVSGEQHSHLAEDMRANRFTPGSRLLFIIYYYFIFSPPCISLLIS